MLSSGRVPKVNASKIPESGFGGEADWLRVKLLRVGGCLLGTDGLESGTGAAGRIGSREGRGGGVVGDESLLFIEATGSGDWLEALATVCLLAAVGPG